MHQKTTWRCATEGGTRRLVVSYFETNISNFYNRSCDSKSRVDSYEGCPFLHHMIIHVLQHTVFVSFIPSLSVNRLEKIHIILISKLHLLLVMVFFFHQLSPSLKERQGVLPLASVKPTPFSGHFPGCHHLTFPEKSTEMTAHNATCLPHIGVGIFRKVADAKFEVPLNTASPIPRKIQKQRQVQTNDVVMYMGPGNSSDVHDNFRSGFSCCVVQFATDNFKRRQLSNLEPILRVSTRVYIYIHMYL